jgi:GxxExxY protein
LAWTNAVAQQLNRITDAIIGAAIRVHKALGPGLLESVYLACLVYELSQQGFSVETQKGVPVSYRGVRLDCGFRADLIVNGSVVVEVKSIERLAPIHVAQMITYVRLTGCTVGLILNFNTTLMKQGIQRVACEFPDDEETVETQSTRRTLRLQRAAGPRRYAVGVPRRPGPDLRSGLAPKARRPSLR